MAFRFSRQLVLPLFLQSQISVRELARRSGVNPRTAERAVNGLSVSSSVVDKVARALGIDGDNVLKFLVAPTVAQI